MRFSVVKRFTAILLHNTAADLQGLSIVAILLSISRV